MALKANKILAAYMTTQQTLILCYKDFEKFDVNLGTAKLKATKFKFENSELQSLKETQNPQLILSRTTFVPSLLWTSTLEVAHSITKEAHFSSVHRSLSFS
jgi:hypothetical protein